MEYITKAYFVALILFLNSVEIYSFVHFQLDKEYLYSYEGRSELHDVGTFYTDSEIGVTVLHRETNGEHTMLLQIHSYHVRVDSPEVLHANVDELNFSNWMSFRMERNGHIDTVWYDSLDTDHIVVELKKKILSMLSNKLVISELSEKSNIRWAYNSTEHGHHGEETSEYQAEPKSDEKLIIYNKQITSSYALSSIGEKYDKEIHLDRSIDIPVQMTLEEEFKSIKNPSNSIMRPPDVFIESNKDQSDFPGLRGTGSSSLKFVRTKEANNIAQKVHIPMDLIQDTLEFKKISDPVISYDLAKEYVWSNLSCMLNANSSEGHHSKIKCFQKICRVMERVSFQNLSLLVDQFKNGNKATWQYIIDGLGATQTNETLILLNELVFEETVETFNITMSALAQLIGLKNCPPQILCDAMLHNVKISKWQYTDVDHTKLVQERALLVLGSLARSRRPCNATWSDKITEYLQRRISVHDPYEHRQKRSQMSKNGFKHYIAQSVLNMMALSNDGHSTSLELFKSYVNDTDSDMQLRCSAIRAIGRYDFSEVADTLLNVGLLDPNVAVKRRALGAYINHPYGGDIYSFIKSGDYMYPNLTDIQDIRMRRALRQFNDNLPVKVKRGIFDKITSKWKGFHFRLEVPGFYWMKMAGGEELGISMGVIIENYVDINIAPLASEVAVNIYDKAWLTAHLGILGVDFHFFQADVCFKGYVGYDMNIFNEFDFEAAAKHAKRLDKMIGLAVSTLKQSITNFKHLVSFVNGLSIDDIIEGFVGIVKNLPKHILSFRQIAKKLFLALDDYTSLPPVIFMVRGLVEKVSDLFNDVKHDVMTLYNAIVDTVQVSIPWAWKQIKFAFNGLTKSLVNIARNPMASVQDIGKNIARISLAVGILLDSKNTIQQANIFDRDNRPYWFDFNTVLRDLWYDVGNITVAMNDTFRWIAGESGTTTELALLYTGVSQRDMKFMVLQELWSFIKNEILGQFDIFDEILDPFITIYNYFMDTVDIVKRAWTALVKAFNIAKTKIQSVFGQKFHTKFPRKYLSSPHCGTGFWKSTGERNYENPGIDLVTLINQPVVAPFNGKVKQSGPRQVTITSDSIKDVDVIIDNVKIARGVSLKKIGAGDIIGNTTNTWCSSGHIHVSMKNTATNKFIDPSKFKRKPNMPLPAWIQECDHYELVLLGETLASGSITKDLQEKINSATMENAPDDSELEEIEGESYSTSDPSRRKKAIRDWFSSLQNFTESLGLGNILDIERVLAFRFENVQLNTLMTYMRQHDFLDSYNAITDLLQQLQISGNEDLCRRPESMGYHELQRALYNRRLAVHGSRGQLIRRLRTLSGECPNLTGNFTADSVCHIEDNCNGMSCCVDYTLFDIFRHSVTFYLKYDPCDQVIILGIDTWYESVDVSSTDIAVSGAYQLEHQNDHLSVIQLVVKYEVVYNDSQFQVSVMLIMCSTLVEECSDILSIANNLIFRHTDCGAHVHNRTDGVDDRGVINTVGDFLEQLDMSGINERVIIDVTDDLREHYVEWVGYLIESAVSEVFGSFTDNNDMCMDGFPLTFGPYHVTFFDPPPVIYPIGWFRLIFEFELSGFYGARFHCEFCILSMKAKATLTPMIGVVATGSIGVGIGPFEVNVILDGYLLETEFPTKLEVGFDKFPVDVKSTMDLKITPLKLVLSAEIAVRIRIPLIRKTIEKVVFDRDLWYYSTKPVRLRIYDRDEKESDETPPEFGSFDDQDEEEQSQVQSRSRAGCNVMQVSGLDYSEPAVNIQFNVDDDRCEPDTTLCVGTFRGGCDVVDREPLAGGASLESRILTSGVPLYFTITAENSEGAKSSIMCQLQNYDTTPPTGRVSVAFLSTSHPNILRCSAFVSDDSPLNVSKISAGYGTSLFGSQIVPWESFDVNEQIGYNNDNINITDTLSFFAVPKVGRLAYRPFNTSAWSYPKRCAEECLTYPPTKCRGFNYDYGHDGACELLESVEGQAKVQTSGSFNYFERLGVGSTAHMYKESISLVHDTVVFCNAYIQNILGYESFMQSDAIHVDFTPPDPGHLIETEEDILIHEDCYHYTPSHLSHRCIDQTPIHNYRFISDVPFSNCVLCNGHVPGTELQWTRANRMVSCHWNHIHDNETGILLFTWAIGTQPCEDNIHPHNDPHAHIHKESEWTNQGVAFPLDLPDGIYHITLTALNKVEFGGPLALRICHTTPYVIDTTPPTIHEITQAIYDEELHVIRMDVSSSDDLSGIKYHELGLGKSRQDTYILPFTRTSEDTLLQLRYQIPDGIPTWVKVRVTNNVNLQSTGHSPRAIFTDASPPEIGHLYIGDHIGEHSFYQHRTDQLCANWCDFVDPQSGISSFMLSFGTSPGYTDIMDFIQLEHTQYIFCKANIYLEHGTEYYATLTAINSATFPRETTSSSAPVLIDTTPPSLGSVQDGTSVTNDIRFSSSPTSVAVTWEGFDDRESEIESFNVTFLKQDSDEYEILHCEPNLPSDSYRLELHHLDLHHRDKIYAEIKAINRAHMVTLGISDGFIVDLTDPIIHHIADGPNENDDIQYSFSTDTFSANWKYSDPESNITQYKLAVFTLTSRMEHQIYPEEGEWIILSPDTTLYESDRITDLQPGHLYFTRVMAINGAGLISVHDTDGFLIDPTPPQMEFVRVGVLSGKYEETIEGLIILHDRSLIEASWKGFDAESNIIAYVVGIGTHPGSDDVRAFSVIEEQYAYLDGINLQYANYETSGPSPVYYITAKAQNGAYQYSDILVSSPMIVVHSEEDRVGIVWDGTGIAFSDDIDFQTDDESISMVFTGFESSRSGLASHAWAIGSAPLYDDVMSFTNNGMIITDEQESSGFATAHLQLLHEQKYYVTIRVITGSGSIMDVSSDGVTVSLNAPPLNITRIGNMFLDTSGIDQIYQQSADLEILWEADDEDNRDEEGERNYRIIIGTVPGANDVAGPLHVTGDELTLRNMISDFNGKPNFIMLETQWENRINQLVTSHPITVDISSPAQGTVDCPAFATGNVINCLIEGFDDLESGIKLFRVALGLTEGDSSVSEFADISHESKSFAIPFQCLDHYTANIRYFVTLIATNNAQLSTMAYSDAIYIDTTPPIANGVVELNDFEVIDNEARFHGFSRVDLTSKALCQRDTHRIHIKWSEFVDDETGIDRYEVALGTAPGGTQIMGFIRLAPSENEFIFNDVNLNVIRTVFTTIRGYNKAGLHTSITSEGVHISRLSAGLSPIHQLYVYDGPTGDDLDYQDNIDSLTARWFFAGDPCPFSNTSWSLYRFDNSLVFPANTSEGVHITVPEGQNYGSVDEIEIEDREAFFANVTSTNALNFTIHMHSDGITVKLEPVLPGTVRDGIIPGIDLSFQANNHTIGCHWNGFGNNQNDEIIDNNQMRDTEIGNHQRIKYYEIAIGSGRSSYTTKTNVRSFTNVGTNTSWVFHNLTLGVDLVYYCTVRAYSISTASTEVTSNGIRVGQGGHILSHGQITLDRYVSSTSSILISWDGFEFSTPILRYYLGIASGRFEESAINCEPIVLAWTSHALADTYSFKDMGLDNIGNLNDLIMAHSREYSAIVVAVDESGLCDVAVRAFKVDTTYPEEGIISLQNAIEMETLYIDQQSVINAKWNNYSDHESGIVAIELKLYESKHCTFDATNNETRVVASDMLSANVTNYTFADLNLEKEKVYFIHMSLTNAAVLTLTSVSRPIVVDTNGPTAGVILDGVNIDIDMDYHNSRTEVTGSFLYQPNNTDTCSRRIIDNFRESNIINTIIHKYLWCLQGEKIDNIHFIPSQVQLEDTWLAISITRMISQPILNSGAIQVDVNNISSGLYKFQMQISQEPWATTVISFWDGKPGLLISPSPICDGDEPDETPNLFRLVDEAFENDTFSEGYHLSSVTGNAFGIYLQKGYNGTLRAAAWGMSRNLYRETVFDVPFETGYHEIVIGVNEERDTNDMHDWDLKFYIDGRLEGVLGGVNGVYNNASVFIGLINHNGVIPDIEDIFSPPSTSTIVKSIEFPPLSGILCQPFQGGDYPIVEFLAGIGSSPGYTNIEPFRPIWNPPNPCGGACVVCDNDEEMNMIALQRYTFTLSNLNLTLYSHDAIANDTDQHLPQRYFLIVKALSASGRAAVASSNGFYIDTTPPIITHIMHFDIDYSGEESIRFQGNDYAIRVAFYTEDPTSGIAENLWAIGTSPYATDIQNYISVGQQMFAFNTELNGLIQNHCTYYVSIQSINEAGLSAFNSSEGVTVLLDIPSVEGTSTTLPGTSIMGTEETNTVQTPSQTNFTVRFDAPPESENIVEIRVSAETSDNQNIFPAQQVGYNSSGEVSLTENGLICGADEIQPLNASRGREKRSTAQSRQKRSAGQLLLEPGRVLRLNIEACNAAHICASIPTEDIAIIRPGDIIIQPREDGYIWSNFVMENVWSNDNLNISISSFNPQISQNILLASGILSETDLSAGYRSDASIDFQPMINDPQLAFTETERLLHGRVRWVSSQGIYMSVVPASGIQGHIIMTYNFDINQFDSEADITIVQPALLAYCPERELWIDVGNTCGSENSSFINLTSSQISVNVCNINSYCRSRTRSLNIEGWQDYSDFSGSHSFVFAYVASGLVNTPPILVSQTQFVINEDAGILEIDLHGYDLENDTFDYLISNHSEHYGNVILSNEGLLTYRPLNDFFGEELISILLRENAVQSNTESLYILNITVLPINDSPRLIAIMNRSCVSDQTHHANLIIEGRSNQTEEGEVFELMLCSYDVDGDGMNISIRTPHHGVVSIGRQVQVSDHREQSCDNPGTVQAEWERFEAYLISGSEAAMTLPCNFPRISNAYLLRWTVMMVRFTPQIGHHGIETMLVNARDNSTSNQPSDPLTVSLYVMANKCQNDGRCRGPATDTRCQSATRIRGFDGYGCDCKKGFRGEFCETCVFGTCKDKEKQSITWQHILFPIAASASTASIVFAIFLIARSIKRKQGKHEQQLGEDTVSPIERVTLKQNDTDDETINDSNSGRSRIEELDRKSVLRSNDATSKTNRRLVPPGRRPHTSASPRNAWGDNRQGHTLEFSILPHQVTMVENLTLGETNHSNSERSTSGGSRSHRALRPSTAPSPSDQRSAAPERRPNTSAGPRRAWGENDQAQAVESDLVSHQVHTDTVFEQVNNRGRRSTSRRHVAGDLSLQDI